MSADFSVVAIIAAYNEADIIEHVVRDLIDQGIHVYLLDDGSTDGTVAAVAPYVGRGVLRIERLSEPAGAEAPVGFDWERILLRKTQLASELDAAWFIHHDADEFRESPWTHLSLKSAIEHVDQLGFNAIDFAGLDFWPVDDGFRAGDDVRRALTFYAEQAPYDRVQIRCWKKTELPVDLASSGGHDVQFPGRKIFPVRFILRHYPIRSQAHGERKVFQERRNRFLVHERARGWHVQYDHVQEGASFIRDPSTLTVYDADALRLSLTLRHRGFEEVQSEVEVLRRDLEQRSVLLARAREELQACSAQAERLRAELEQRASEIAANHAELDARNAEIARVNQALEQRDADILQWRAAVDGLTRRVDELHRSLSWRWTAPARAAYRALKGW
jgi:hypothetical protein